MEVVLFLTKLLQFETGETNRIEYEKTISRRSNGQLALVRDLIDLICGSHHLNIAFSYQNSVRSQIYFDYRVMLLLSSTRVHNVTSSRAVSQ